jgi:4-amino-4-deoxy-L-arabinose transferase-like glycosyltransferase
MKRGMALWADAVLIVALLTAASAAILFRLGASTLEGWDEGIYAEVSREMLRTGDWLIPHYASQPLFEKPPLMMWITAAFFSIFGVSDFWARAASAFAGTLLVLVTYLIGRKAYGRAVGLLAAAMMLTGAEFLARARNGRMDILLTLFVYLAVLAYQRSRADKRYWYAIGVFFALAFMTKSWAALIIPPSLFLALWLEGRLRDTMHSRSFWGGAALSLILIIPWHAAMLILYRDAFLQRYWMFDLISRSTTAVEENVGGPLYYLQSLQVMFAPWAALCPFALAAGLRDLLQKKRRAFQPVLLILIAVVFGVYTVVQTKLAWYIAPLYPALRILVACALVSAYRATRGFMFGGLVFSLVVALLSATGREVVFLLLVPALGLLILLRIGWRLRTSATGNPHAIDQWPVGPVSRLRAALLRAREYWRGLPAGTVLSRALVVLVAIFFFGISEHKASRLYRPTIDPLATISTEAGLARPQQPLLAMGVYVGTATNATVVLYYSQRPVTEVENTQQLASYMGNAPAPDAVLSTDAVEALAPDYRVTILAQDGGFVYGTLEKTAAQ